jgi:multiple sugar transport system permease protein
MFQRTPTVRVWTIAALIVVGGFLFLPILWLIRTGITPLDELFSSDFTWLPSVPTFDNFVFALAQTDLPRFLLNSLIVAGLAAVVSTALASYAAYGLTVFRFRFSRPILTLFLLAHVFPVALILVSLFPLMAGAKLLNSYLGLGIGYIMLSLPSALYIMHGFMQNFPSELVEAARIDGAGEFRAFHSVVFPVIRPGLIAVFVFAFMWGWNDLLFSVTLISSQDLRTLGPGLLTTYLGQFRNNWGGIMAASIIASVPVVVLFIWLQKYFVRGITAGAVKG